jgi:integrase
MSPLIALLILGSVATSASAAAVDEVLSPLSHQQQSRLSHPPNSGLSQRRRARELAAVLAVLKRNRHGHRDWLIGLLIYRHGLRVSEACDLRWDDIDSGLIS